MVQWKLNGTDISNDTHYSINATSGTLTINEVRSTDTGNYTCGSGNISLTVKIPDIIFTGNYTGLTVGSSVSIICTTVPSIPNSEIKWHSSSTNSDSNELIINPVVLSHNNSTFTCEVSSDLLAMDLTESITISVLDTSVSSVTVQSLSSYVIGDDVSIVCTISLNNAIGPNVSSLVVNWFKNDEMIPTDNINSIKVSSSTFNSTLTLTNVSSADAGVYTCNASINGSDIKFNDSKDLCLKVQNVDSYIDLPLGYSATIKCVTHSLLNRITIKWTDSDGSTITNNNALILPNVVPSLNNTEYTCTAKVGTNPATCLPPDNKNIKIYTRKTYVSSISMSSQSSFLINSTVKIECTIILNTPVGPGIQPTVTWYHNVTDVTQYSPLMRNNESTVFTSLLTIDSIQVSDAGVYQCNAGIDPNVTTKSISVCVTVNETLPLVTEELSLGQYYSIDCITGPVPTGVSVSWFTNGSINSNNNTLMIPSVLPSHNNTQYTCTIMIETNPPDCSTESQVITFRVQATYINSVTIASSSVTRFVNSSVLLTCTISLNTGIGPDTSFISHYWYQYSTDISNRSTQLMINGDSKSLVTTLTIDNVQLSNAGKYQCRASIDGHDTVIHNFTNLCVQVPVMNNLDDTNLRLGDIIEYDCTLGYRYSGVDVHWVKYGSNKRLNNPLILTVNQSINNTVYICYIPVMIVVGCPTQQVNILVTVKDTFIKTVVTNVDSLILSNTFQQLECHITTNTDINTTNTNISSIVNVLWYRDNSNGKRLVSYNENKGVSIIPIVSLNDTSFNSTLRFNPITSSTPISILGIYTCVAMIREQSGRSITSKDIRVMMKINNTEDVVSMSLNEYYTAGYSFNANCTITANQLSPPIDTKGTVNIIHNDSAIRSNVFDIGATGSHKRSLHIPFTNLKLSQSGDSYNCSYIRNSTNSFVQKSNIISNNNQLNIKIPNKINSTASINPFDSPYEVGSDITLNCSISYHKPPYIDIDTVVNISWINNEDDILNNITIAIENYTEHNLQYYITNFHLSDAGQYKCSNTHHTQQEYKFIQSSESQYKYINITAIIPISSTSLVLKSTESYYEAGTKVTLSCKVTEPDSPLVNVDTTVNIKWSPNKNIPQYSNHSYSKYFNYTLNNIKLSDAGEYNCTYYLNTTTDNPYIIPSDVRTGVTDVTIKFLMAPVHQLLMQI
uniref:Ig-like domain-containing protein n=1 Tax=Amphimedon queenslandica TaxID=400682 RepID=A0A1X7V1J9_AMPQE